MHSVPHGREYGKGILSSRIHVTAGKFNKRSKEAHRRAFKSGKKRVLQKEAGGGKAYSWWEKRKIGFSKETVI